MFPETILGPDGDVARFARILDELGPVGRLDTIRHLDKPQMARLFEGAKDLRPLALSDLVPESTATRHPVIHEGKNTVPVFSGFQKQFMRPADGAETLWGMNESWYRPFIGPGYFVVRPSPEEPGALLVDYGALPAEQVAPWPRVVPPRLIGWFVFGGLVDILRGVSSHVVIGRATRRGRLLDEYFALCRIDDPPTP